MKLSGTSHLQLPKHCFSCYGDVLVTALVSSLSYVLVDWHTKFWALKTAYNESAPDIVSHAELHPKQGWGSYRFLSSHQQNFFWDSNLQLFHDVVKQGGRSLHHGKFWPPSEGS